MHRVFIHGVSGRYENRELEKKNNIESGKKSGDINVDA
jgi:hypothetical protein